MHPTRPLALWVVVAIACAALLTAEGTLAEGWLSVATVAVVLASFFAAVDEELANFLLTDLWFGLQMAAWFVAGCAFLVALVYLVRENTQQGAGMQQ